MNVHDLEKLLATFSGLHDGELMKVTVEAWSRTVDIACIATHFETDVQHTVSFKTTDVTDFHITRHRSDNPAFSDYSFPANTLIDGASVTTDKRMMSMIIEGTYGWRLTCAFGAVSARVTRQTDRASRKTAKERGA